MTWILSPTDTDQPILNVWHIGDVVGLDCADITCQLTPKEARHLAGALMVTARNAEQTTAAT